MLLAGCLAMISGCAPAVAPYSIDEAVHLEKGDPSPFVGWLLSDADLEMLLKSRNGKEG